MRRKQQWRSRAHKLSLLTVAAFVIFAFQNCTQPYEGDGLSANSRLAKKMEFSYDTTIDQIAYMSCPALKDGFDQDTYFSLRAGAYRTGGIKLKDSFFETHSRKLPDRLIDLLRASPANSNTVMQLAVRETGALNNLVAGAGEPKRGFDYTNIFAGLGAYETSAYLVKNGLSEDNELITGKRTKYMRSSTMLRGARVEGSLNFSGSESIASSLRDGYLNTGKAVMALTYAHAAASGSETNVRTPGLVFEDTPVELHRAYGSAFRLTFLKPPGAKGFPNHDMLGEPIPGTEQIAYPNNLLFMVDETNLLDQADKTNVGTWACPENLRFRIVKPGDLTDANCKRSPDPEPSKVSADEAFRVAIARNSLRVEDWYIDFVNKGPNDGGCIIPKKDLGSCYADLPYVQYAYNSSPYGCDPNSTSNTNALKSPICLAWVSICYRTN